MEQSKELLKCMEVMWGNNPMPELLQCVMLVCWEAAEASSMVEVVVGRVEKLEVVLAVVKMCLIEAHRVWQCWQDIMAYGEAGVMSHAHNLNHISKITVTNS
jgi:hypothetical protein